MDEQEEFKEGDGCRRQKKKIDKTKREAGKWVSW